MVSIDSWSSSVSVIGAATVVTLIGSSSLVELQERHLGQAAQVSRGLTELGGQKRLHDIPGHARPRRPAADADDVHVVVLDALACGKMVMDEPGADTWNLVRADRGAHTAAADGHSALERPCRHRLGERDDKVGIVIVRGELVRTEIDDVVPGGAESCDQVPFQGKTPVIGGDSHAHGVFSAMWRQRRDGSRPNRAAASWSASTKAWY
jgi:hypothetical protein